MDFPVNNWITDPGDPRIKDQGFEANGLLKAFIEPTSLDIPGIDWEKYRNKPERLGVTIACGRFPKRMLRQGIGEEVLLHCWDVVLGEETVSIDVSGGYQGRGIDGYPDPNEDPYVFYLGDIEKWTAADHMTLGWVDGSAPIVAGKEMKHWRSGISGYPSIFPIDLDWEIVKERSGKIDQFCSSCLKAKIEFLPFDEEP